MSRRRAHLQVRDLDIAIFSPALFSLRLKTAGKNNQRTSLAVYSRMSEGMLFYANPY